MNIDDITEELDALDDNLDKLRFVVTLGQGAPSLPLPLRTEANRLRGCTSNAWVLCHWEGGPPAALALQFDAEAAIVKGLLAIVAAALAGKSPREVESVDVPALMARLGLAAHLSPSRTNGLAAAVARIQGNARSQP